MATEVDVLPQLTNDEIKRYSRHLIMPEVGVDGQKRLKAGSVLCIGAGGLGSPAAMYLAAAVASSTSTSLISATCSARSSTAPLTSGAPSWRRQRTVCWR